jgi:hypothetical protein
MINTMTPPVLWPALVRLHNRLRVGLAARRERKHYQLEVERLPDRLLRDVGIYERPARRVHTASRPWI